MRRAHSKILKLPPRFRDAIRDALVKHGKTYDQLSDLVEQWVAAGEITSEQAPSRAGLARFGRNELARLELHERSREYAKAVVAKAEEYGMVLDEAAANIALNEFMTIFAKRDPHTPMDPAELARMMTGLGKLQSSSAQREKVKGEFQKRTEAAAKKVAATARKAGLSKEAIAQIERDVLGIAS